MRFIDPMPYNCPACGVDAVLPVRELLSLSAHCPACGAALDEIGLGMRRLVDDNISFFHGVDIIMYLENHLGIQIPDQHVITGEDWSKVTLNDLAAAARRSSLSTSPSLIDETIRSAVRELFPNASANIDFTLPLRDVTSPTRFTT